MKAKIIKDIQNYKNNSRIGETVEIIRLGFANKYWVKTIDGKEMSFPRKYLEILPDEVDQWVDELIVAEKEGAK